MTHLRTIATATILTLSVSACSTSGMTPPMQATSAGSQAKSLRAESSSYSIAPQAAQPDASVDLKAAHSAATPAPLPTYLPLPATISPHPLTVVAGRPLIYTGNTISPHPAGPSTSAKMRVDAATSNTITPHPTHINSRSHAHTLAVAIPKTISPHPIVVRLGPTVQASSRTRLRASVPAQSSI